MHSWRRIQIEIDDELTDVLEKMQESDSTDLALIIPGRSLLLTSMINLRLIRKKATNLSKQVVIITRDSMGRNLAEKAGMRSLRTDEELEGMVTDEPLTQEQDPNIGFSKKNIKNTPVNLAKGKEKQKQTKEKDRKSPTSSKNTSKTKRDTLPATLLGKARYLVGLDREDEIKEISQFRVQVTPASKKAFVSILSISLILLVGISIFALPHATVELTPKLANVPVFSNITLLNSETDAAARQVQVKEVTVEYEKEYEYAATGQKFDGTSSRGRVRIFNREGNSRSIVGNSRLQTQSGLVFLTTSFVTVPAARGGNPGAIDVDVVARDQDIQGKFTGDRGNIGPSKFFFPALTSGSQQLLFAESFSAMQGGTSKTTSKITAEDLDVANKNIVTDLELLSEEKLREELGTMTLTGNIDLFQPTDARFVSKELVKVDIPRNLIGSEQPTFKVTGKMRARGYYYDRDDIVKILEAHFKNHQLTYNQDLVTMDRATMSFANIFPPREGQIKVTAKINGVVSYSFDSDNNELASRIKDNIVGADRAKAMSYLQNLSEVDAVDIKLSPWWQKTLPTLKENITISIKKVTKS